jgi:RNA polymerase sigma factor (sigma-70 family)
MGQPMHGQFATTSWTRILAAREAHSGESQQALEEICQAYWYPLYAFVRRQGHGAEEARDLTQAYFAELIEKHYLEDFDPWRGRFRVFLQASVKHFLSKEREKARALKRGGQRQILSLDQDAEGRYEREPADRLTPEQVYERRWALTLLERVLGQLRLEFAKENREKEFEYLKGFLTGDTPKIPYREVASDLQMSEGAVKGAVHRLRQRFGLRLRQEIAGTVEDPDDVDDEVRYLLGAIAPWGPPAA